MFERLHRHKSLSVNTDTAKLYNDGTFYPAFMRDLNRCSNQAFIESPFITTKRVTYFQPAFRRLADRGVEIVINTRDPREHDVYMTRDSLSGVALLQGMGVKVLYTGGVHRKIAILDQAVVWTGSLNILSQTSSVEIMLRLAEPGTASTVLSFINMEKYL